jgi:hypothetical protein
LQGRRTSRRQRSRADRERADLWFRATACFRREGGASKITHVHNSVPFAMDGSDRALLDLKPESGAMRSKQRSSVI